jgi:hypothetical protein
MPHWKNRVRGPSRSMASALGRCHFGVLGMLVNLVFVGTACSHQATAVNSVGGTDSVVRAWTPDWYPAGALKRFPRERYLVGVGSCGNELPSAERANCALQSAREQVALEIKAKIAANIEHSKTLTTRSSGENLDATVQAHWTRSGKAVTALELEGVTAAEQVCVGDNCYAVVVLDRRRFECNLRERNVVALSKMNDLLVSAKNADTVQALFGLSKAEILARQIDERSALIATVGASLSTSTSAELTVSAARRRATGGCTVCLSSSLSGIPTELLFTTTRQSLGLLGFKRVVFASDQDCGTAKLNITYAGVLAARQSTEMGGAHVIDINGQLSVRQSGKLVGATMPIVARGVAKDAARSRHEAIVRVSSAIASAFVALVGGQNTESWQP